jgi:hypothetical protein
MNAISLRRGQPNEVSVSQPTPPLVVGPTSTSYAIQRHEDAARQRELTVRLIALVIGIVGAPSFAVIAILAGHPLIAVGSLGSATPLAVARLIREPGSG